MSSSFWPAFEARSDLQKYGNNALLVYALQLRYQIEDIHAVADVSLTDGPDDKKCDLIYIDTETETAVVAQGWNSNSENKDRIAKSNKASDLNVAASWLLAADEDDIPDRIKLAALELREGLRNGLISSIEFWYVHNVSESDQVRAELDKVIRSADALLKRYFKDHDVEVKSIEVGSRTLETWYRSLTVQILVGASFDIPVDDAYVITGASGSWRAISTSVQASWLYDLFDKHKSDLNSANVRSYLGSRRSAENINDGIRKTAQEEPDHFWVYNNGITALCHSIDYDEEHKTVSISGISIVNGAQTTGVIGNLPSRPVPQMKVPARFIECGQDTDFILRIIRFNNRQNPVKATDFRSNDKIQTELVRQFNRNDVPGSTYSGGRRGGETNAIKRPGNALPAETVAQVLAAFSGQPQVAYHQKSKIWENDSFYSDFFVEGETSARHIGFIWGLWLAINSRKDELKIMPESQLKKREKHQLDFLRHRGATLLVLAAIAEALEEILGQAIPSRRRLRFKKRVTVKRSKEIWLPVVKASLNFATTLEPAVKSGLRSKSPVDQNIQTFVNMIASVADANEDVFSQFASEVETAKV